MVAPGGKTSVEKEPHPDGGAGRKKERDFESRNEM